MTPGPIFQRGCAVRPLSELPEPLEEPPPPEGELSDDELPALDCVAPEEVIAPRPLDDSRGLDDPLELVSDFGDASRVRTRV